ncbi:hypothetical protein BJX76DRAFT_351572 [Aspergillus varians]
MHRLIIATLFALLAMMASTTPTPINKETTTDLILNGTASFVHDEDTTTTANRLSKRHNLQCIPAIEAQSARADHIIEGIRHLRETGGRPTLGAHKCEQVSCEWGDVIIWCNDAKTTRSLPSYTNIADGAQVIFNGCKYLDSGNNGFGGILDHPDKWRVIVDGYKTRVGTTYNKKYKC